MDIEGKILELIRDQSIIQHQAMKLQAEIDKLQRQQTHKGGQLEMCLEWFKEAVGKTLQDAMNQDPVLREKIVNAQEEGKRIASGMPAIPNMPNNGGAEQAISAFEQGQPPEDMVTTESVASPQKVPALKRVAGNKPMAALREHKVVVDDMPPPKPTSDDESIDIDEE